MKMGLLWVQIASSFGSPAAAFFTSAEAQPCKAMANQADRMCDYIMSEEKISAAFSDEPSGLVKPFGVMVGFEEMQETLFGFEEKKRAAKLLDLPETVFTAESLNSSPEVLEKLEILIGTWGTPLLDETFLERAPNLKAVFYAAGSVKSFVTDAFWDRKIVLTSAYAMNAVPVAEFTVAQMVLAAKKAWQAALDIKSSGQYAKLPPGPGMFQSTMGLISLGMIGRLVCERLKTFDVKILAYDPFLSEEEAYEIGVEKVSLDAIFERSDVVSLHTPWLKETEQMIRGHHFERMREGASFINTARGAVVHEAEMIAVLEKRPDLLAILDVTYPEPPVEGSPFYKLPNVILTPHIAGSVGLECRRMTQQALDELENYLAGRELRYSINREKAAILA